ncbi:MAG: FixH family protein, partial [Gammaproteobacteria bacterium]|nr:FixH family protein [Gammaproteobacteria bacterium]
MNTSRTLLWVGGIIALLIIGGGTYFFLSGSGASDPTVVTQDDMPRYRAAGLEIGVRTDPAIPRVGNNRLILEVRDANGDPVSTQIEAYGEMPAMGAMPAMRAPADLKETEPGRYEGSMDLSMRGEWPLTMSFEAPNGQLVRLQFDLATDRAELSIAAGGTRVGGATMPMDDANVITIDNRRRQMIGVEIGEATHRDLVKSIRAVGEVTFDERLLS